VVSPKIKRAWAENAIKNQNLSQRRAFKLVNLHRSVGRYKSKRQDDEVVKRKIKAIALDRPRFGYRRIYILLRKQGDNINHKKLFRLYRGMGLKVRKRGSRKRAVGIRIAKRKASKINEIWSLDFMGDRLADGRKIRLLNIVDEFTRESLRIVIDTSLSGLRVTRELESIIKEKGKPCQIISDNGTEFTSQAILKWSQENSIEWGYIDPGKPMQNGTIESFNGKLRDEFLNQHWFITLNEARDLAEKWRQDYNQNRPHSSLKGLTPNEFIRSFEEVNQNNLIA
jgi:putative transposase